MSEEHEQKQSQELSNQKEKESAGELPEEQLKTVSGGTTNICSICKVPIPCACIP